MVFSVQQIKYEFLLYIKGLGGEFGDWYVGCAADPEQALFALHGVHRSDDPWIYKPALTGKATHTLVRYFRDVLHTDAPPEQGPLEGHNFAYAFKKSATTRPGARVELATADHRA